ncbi:MAG: hypothetical protein WDA75_12475 [Candidatus Latescibacterota bacterium]|jgi:hypothetical protein
MRHRCAVALLLVSVGCGKPANDHSADSKADFKARVAELESREDTARVTVSISKFTIETLAEYEFNFVDEVTMRLQEGVHKAAESHPGARALEVEVRWTLPDDRYGNASAEQRYGSFEVPTEQLAEIRKYRTASNYIQAKTTDYTDLAFSMWKDLDKILHARTAR